MPDEPGQARKSPEEPGRARKSPDKPGQAWTSPGEPGRAPSWRGPYEGRGVKVLKFLPGSGGEGSMVEGGGLGVLVADLTQLRGFYFKVLIMSFQKQVGFLL